MNDTANEAPLIIDDDAATAEVTWVLHEARELMDAQPPVDPARFDAYMARKAALLDYIEASA